VAAWGAWIFLWIVLGVALVATGSVLAVRVLGNRRNAAAIQSQSGESAAVRGAKDALRLRFANGEISREAYLQGKVELED